MLNKLFRNALGVAALGLSCFAAAVDKDSVTFNGWEPVQTSLANIETGSLRTNVFTVGGYALGRIRFEGHLNEINGIETLATGDYGTESQIRVKYPDGRFKDVSITSVANYDTPSGLDVSGQFVLAPGAAAPFGGGTWSFYYINTFDDPVGTPDGLPDCSLDITFYLTDEQPAPPNAVDLGTVSDPGLSQTFDHVSGQIEWFKITVPEATLASKYLDIDSEGTTGITDTEIGIYTAAGELVASDDDDGSSLLSQLSFGPEAGDRGNSGFTGLNYDGRDGVLNPGVYYIACGQFNVTFNPTDFDVTTSSTGSGSFTLNIRTNVVGGPSSSISGNVGLTDYDPFGIAGQMVTVEIRDAIGNPVATVNTALDASGNFSFATPGAVTPGTYTITCKHPLFLRKALTGQNVTATGISGLSYPLTNGDCDDDNEVGISDYAIISFSYNACFPDPAFDSRSDLNGDTCCDIADYAILSANYGLIGDD